MVLPKLLVPTRTASASRTAHFYFPIPISSIWEESHRVWSKDKLSMNYYTFRSVKVDKTTLDLYDKNFSILVV